MAHAHARARRTADRVATDGADTRMAPRVAGAGAGAQASCARVQPLLAAGRFEDAHRAIAVSRAAAAGAIAPASVAARAAARARARGLSRRRAMTRARAAIASSTAITTCSDTRGFASTRARRRTRLAPRPGVGPPRAERVLGGRAVSRSGIGRSQGDLGVESAPALARARPRLVAHR